MPARRHAVIAALMLAAAGTAQATTRSSFVSVSGITGITVTSPTALQRTVLFQPGAAFAHNGSSYLIQDIIGFYALSDDLDFAPVSSVAALGNFKNDSSNASTGGILGWKSNPNKGITSGNSLTFTFSAGTNVALIDRLGFHVRLASGNFPGTSGNTGNITGPLAGFSTIPSPAAAAVLALGGLAASRRRRPR